MANLGYILGGAAPVIKKFMVGATPQFAVAGAPAIVAATQDAGVVPQSAGTVGQTVGLALDTATYTTTQATVVASGAAQVSVVVNPDAVYRLRVSGGATPGTALTAITNSVLSTSGLLVTITAGDVVPTSPNALDGTIIGITGNNVGVRRRATTVAATTVTVLVPFPYTIAVGDKFLLLPYFPGGITITGTQADNLTLTTTPGTLATEARVDVASSTAGVRYGHVDIVCDTADSNRVLNETYLLASPTIHIYKNIA